MAIPGEDLRDNEWEEVDAQDKLQEEYGASLDKVEEGLAEQYKGRGRQAVKTLNPEEEIAEEEKEQNLEQEKAS